MKIPIETTKIFVTALILFMALLFFPASSFGWEGCVYSNEGEIYGLEFDFGPGLPLELPGLGAITVTYVVVEASGSEVTHVTPFKQYIYEASLWKGWDNLAKGKVYAYTQEMDWLEFKFKSASLFESFKIKTREIDDACAGKEVTVPKDVDLYFEVTKVTPVGMPWLKFNLILKIEDGIPVIIDVW